MPLLLFMILIFTASLSARADETDSNHYTTQHFVANRAKYKPSYEVNKKLVNGWGIATRPAGAGGHFWVVANKHSLEYVGDVTAAADAKLHALHVDGLKEVTLPVGGKDNVGTGVVFVDSKSSFIITQEMKGFEPITAPSKFIFASDGGIISAWTERKNADGSFDRPVDALTVVDASNEGAQFFGLALNSANDRLYVADFGERPAVRVFDAQFKPVDITFEMPFDENKNGKVDAGEYAPFNVQSLKGHVFVTYAKTQACPREEIKKKSCAKGALFVGEEDTTQAGYGRLAEFDEEGRLIAVWNDGGKLSAPWGLAIAPENFGALSGMLLVANFGDGTIAAYDTQKREFVDVMRGKDNKPVIIDKIWGLIFGNGVSLGDSNALYFTAGPDDERDGVFGSLRAAP